MSNLFKFKRESAVMYIMIFFIFVASATAFDDVLDCGGFIAPSSSLASKLSEKIDYSELFNIKLLTLTGIEKYSTEPAPNGYYIIPIYDKGNYVIHIEGPEGWSFSPDKYQIEIEEDTVVCNNGENVDFKFTGFTVSGKVEDKNSKQVDGFENILVQLVSDSDVLKSYTKPDGTYVFENVFPKEYSIQVSHPTWSFQHETISIVSALDNFFVEESFIITGYDFSGVVYESSHGGDPVKNVNFLLFSDNQGIELPECDKSDIPILNKKEYPVDPVCSVKSGENGRFHFKNIPLGKYEIVPYYTDLHTTFDVVPNKLSVSVDQYIKQLEKPFFVKGFSVKGKVVGTDGKGISGVYVHTKDEKISAITDSEGEYKLDQVTTGEYTLYSSKENYVFNPLRNFRITPTIVEIPETVVHRYQICGKISIPQPPKGIKISSRTVYLVNNEEKSSIQTDVAGNYCFDVLPGVYTIAPDFSEKEIELGLLLKDSEFEIIVDAEPVLDVNFEQARLMVTGQINCIESPCDTSLSVSLSAIGRSIFFVHFLLIFYRF
eukprot:TRINITY_DN8651_c0_g1_i1.p2 TRINITY_DN8651_c0_g1~~TRINITY_DN8651_c0_g1_i1.p2  ORF type:complete len:546 (-),score=134.67 TRINITY_DN8651_c0_g1_i1:1952-3589(-)